MSTLILRNVRATPSFQRVQSHSPIHLLSKQRLSSTPAILSISLRYASTNNKNASKPHSKLSKTPPKPSHPPRKPVAAPTASSKATTPSSPPKPIPSPTNLLKPSSSPNKPPKPIPSPTNLLKPSGPSSTAPKPIPSSTNLLKPSTATDTSSNDPSPVNGPLSTLPAPINAPTRKPSQALPLYLFALGKSYVAFYKTGIKNIWANRKTANALSTSIKSQHNGSISAAIEAGAITRSDFQLLRRNAHDVRRVPAFALVLLVCGEFTPFVVLLATGIVPWTCRIPKQIDGDRAVLEKRRGISFRNLTLPPPEQAGVEQLQRMQLLHISWSLGLSSKTWDWLGGQLPGLPTGILRRKVKSRVDYLEMDDGLIRKAGGVREMSEEEIRMASVERGIDILGKETAALKGSLDSWLRSAEEVPVERLLLTRPAAWPVRKHENKSKNET